MSLSRLANIFRHPVLPENKENLRRAWERLPESLRTPLQMYGRHAEGCGATIGAMPRCDFACTGCYLGDEANRIPAESVDAIKAQIRALRPALGPRGNLQLTDGEVTLRPAEELIELIRYARSQDLIPMLMTHGDTFRRQPGLLRRLVEEGGLTELSIHVDTTQRGRVGRYRFARTEADLNPLRDEFAEMIRDVRRATGRNVGAATTMTIDSANLGGVPDVMRWLLRNADVFKMISFQPMAQVGRTEAGLGGAVTVDGLWQKIADGLDGEGADLSRLLAGRLSLGHTACNRYVPGYVVRQPDAAPAFHSARDANDPKDLERNTAFWGAFGGLSFRDDDAPTAAARALGVLAHGAKLFARELLPYLGWVLKRLDRAHPARLLLRWATGRAKVNGLLIVSHHFMSDFEIDTAEGRERLAACVFHVPIDGKLVPMCEVNHRIRDAYYEDIRAGRKPGSGAPAPAAAMTMQRAKLPVVA